MLLYMLLILGHWISTTGTMKSYNTYHMFSYFAFSAEHPAGLKTKFVKGRMKLVVGSVCI